MGGRHGSWGCSPASPKPQSRQVVLVSSGWVRRFTSTNLLVQTYSNYSSLEAAVPAFTLVLPGKACPVMSLTPAPRTCGKCSLGLALPDTFYGRLAFLLPVPVKLLGPQAPERSLPETPPFYCAALRTNSEYHIRLGQRGPLWYLIVGTLVWSDLS